MKHRTPKAPRVIDRGDGWRIEYDPHAGDYTAIIDMDDMTWNPLPSAPTKDEARGLIFDYFNERATPETAAQVVA